MQSDEELPQLRCVVVVGVQASPAPGTAVLVHHLPLSVARRFAPAEARGIFETNPSRAYLVEALEVRRSLSGPRVVFRSETLAVLPVRPRGFPYP